MKLRWSFVSFAIFAALLVGYASMPKSTTAQAVIASDPVCDQLVAQAVASAGALCGSTGSNTACYGNPSASVEGRGSASPTFSQPGNIASLSAVPRLNTSPLDPQTNTWGIAVLKAQTTLPADAPEQVTFVLFGDATLDNPTEAMDAVTLQTRLDDPACIGAPNSGLIIHSPEETQVQLMLNGADVVLGSCAFVTAQSQGDLTIAITSGTGIITASGTTRVVPPGAQVRIPLGGSDGLQVNGEPSELEPFDYDAIILSPLLLAGCPGEVPPPMSDTLPTPQTTASTLGCQRPDWTFTYVVPFGDTLSRIALSIGISLQELAEGNGITDVNVLTAGQVLCVPRSVPPFVFRTRTPTPTVTGTLSATPTVTGTLSATPSSTNTPVPTDTLTATNTPIPTNTLTATNTPMPTDTLTATNTPLPTATDAIIN